ncbi:MAG: VWA domain-containing protein, partial [Pseudomonadota bacterium]
EFSIWKRLTSGAQSLWRIDMNHSLKLCGMNGAAVAALLLVPVAGVLTYDYLNRFDSPGIDSTEPAEPAAVGQRADQSTERTEEARLRESEVTSSENIKLEADLQAVVPRQQNAPQPSDSLQKVAPEAPTADAPVAFRLPQDGWLGIGRQLQVGGLAENVAKPPLRVRPLPEPPRDQRLNRDRIENFASNPIKRVAEEPVSTFSIDVDTASYSLVRRSLRDGILPAKDSIRIEELINYFDYDWPVPESRSNPFEPTVTVMPTPWNQDTLLMHVAIKGYDIEPQVRPASNLVFLVDTSGSMQDADKLPLVKSSLKLLLNQMGPEDTISLVTYAGEAGVALEPVKASEKAKIVAAIDKLGAGGSTAGSAGLETAYQLVEEQFVEDGVNRILLATDGDFNVGPSDDSSLKRLIEEKRKSGIFLSVLGFGQGNYNDQLMQTLAQNGNGTAAYIDTLAEAEKTLVQEAQSSLFPIAKDVKIQVEFNPSRISEYRLIGYETRALAREDFNNDRVDAGDIGSGHSVTAIYELTPVGSPALSVDALRYGNESASDVSQVDPSDEIGFVKLRYKQPDGVRSELISLPVGSSSQVADFSNVADDVRFSVAVAAFGQKLRDTDAVADFSYEEIGSVASTARGADPYGYRSEFLSLVRLADGLTDTK